MKPADIAAAINGYIETGDIEPVRAVLDAIADGRVEAKQTPTRVILAVASRPTLRALSAQLQSAQIQSGKTYTQIADEVGVSLSSVQRLMAGHVLPQWPVFRDIAEACNIPATRDLRRAYVAAREERTF